MTPVEILKARQARIAPILKAGRARIAEPEHWCQGAFALDAAGSRTRDPEKAMRFCALGAIALFRSDGDGAAWHYLESALRAAKSRSRSVSEYNDSPSRTHADILALYDRAIALAEQEDEA